MLLRHVRGATSFEYLRTVDGVTYATFQEACEALDLVIHNDEYDLCLHEAALMKHPRQMRRLFGLIMGLLNEDTIAQAPFLWRKYRVSMVEDFTRRGWRRNAAFAQCVREIDVVLSRNRPELTCADLGIVADETDGDDGDADDDVGVVGGGGIVDGVHISEWEEEEVDEVEPFPYSPRLLNVEQKQIFLRIVQAVSRTTGKVLPVDLYDDLGEDVSAEDITVSRPREHLFFVDGPGGTGKTFLYNTLCTYVSSVLDIPVVSIAWTGIAASLLVGGKTVHRTFRLPIRLTNTSTVGWHLDAPETNGFRQIGLILWDEAPMTHRYAVEAVDRYLREVAGVPNLPMGGKCCVFGGDFRQVLPVIPRGHRTNVIDASLKRLSYWGQVVELQLTTNVRAGRLVASAGEEVIQCRPIRGLNDKPFDEWLLALGEGRLPYVVLEGHGTVPADLVEVPALFHCPDLERLIRFVYSDGFDAEGIGERAILAPTNAMIDTVNDLILEMLEGDYKTFVSVDECKRLEEDELEIPMDVLNAVNVAGLPPHELKLKVGAIVMLLRNLDVEMGECNGTRMRVVGFDDHLLRCQLVTGQNRGRSVWLPKIRMIARDTMVPYEVMRTQFPVRLAYAMTINKAQGQTLKRVGIYLQRPCFAHGQLYVAFSRVGNPDNVRVYVEDGLKQGSFRHRAGKKFTRNIVYHALLRSGPLELSQQIPQFVPRGDIAEEAELQELFGLDDDEMFEHLDVSQVVREQGAAAHQDNSDEENEECGSLRYPPSRQRRQEAETEDRRAPPVIDCYVDETGSDIPGLYVPYRDRVELAARVSHADRPGTSGIGLPRRSLRLPRPSTSSESD